jgi:hypothetical protein
MFFSHLFDLQRAVDMFEKINKFAGWLGESGKMSVGDGLAS